MDLWTLLTALICGLVCSFTGSWLVLKRMSMMADAISHSVLPGLIGAFLITGSRAPGVMLCGSIFAALVTIGLTQVSHHIAKIQEEASLGISYSLLFALGVFLATRYAAQVDLDPGCILYGNIETVIFDTTLVFQQEVPKVFINLLGYAVLSGSIFFLLRRLFLISVFDPSFGKITGAAPSFSQTFLFILIACCTVVCFEAVGSILVIALMIVPPASAQLLTKKLKTFFIISVSLGLISSFIGYLMAVLFDTSVAGCIATVLGIIYMFVALNYAYHQKNKTKALRALIH